MEKILLTIIIIGLMSCNENSKYNVTSINSGTSSDKELSRSILQQGDSSAYYELSMQYLDYGYEHFLPYSLIMANKYNYPQAYFDVYDCLLLLYGSEPKDICLLDSVTQKIAIEYLKKASSEGHSQARSILGEYYLEGIYFEKDTLLGNLLVEEAENLPY